jgi:hypothetical protein
MDNVAVTNFSSELSIIMPKLKTIDFGKSKIANPLNMEEKRQSQVLANFLKMLSISHRYQIKSFVAPKVFYNQIPFDEFYFEKLGIMHNSPAQIRTASVVARQYHLKELDLTSTFIMDDVIKEIINNLEDLEILKINCEGITPKSLSLLSAMKNITDLQLDVINVTKHWITAAMAAFKFEAVKKLALVLPQLELPVDCLDEMLIGNYSELKLVTAQSCALQNIFSSKTSQYLVSVTLEITKENKCSFPLLVKGIYRSAWAMESLKVINHNENVSKQTRELIALLTKLPMLTKLYLEGFHVDETFHKACLKSLTQLEELTLLSYELNTNYIIPMSAKRAIEKCEKLKFMKISCSDSLYTNAHRFPVAVYDENKSWIIYRHR